MRRALRLLLMLTVLWCGLHLDVTAGAQACLAHGEHIASASSDDPEHERDEPTKARHASHHHCPVAPDQRLDSVQDAVEPAEMPLFVGLSAALTSLATAPPLEPPTA